MRLDRTISNSGVALGALALFVIVGNWIELKQNPMPPPERYRKDGGLPWVALWNLFDETRFTPEAIRFHRRRLGFTVAAMIVFGLGWVLLDAIW